MRELRRQRDSMLYERVGLAQDGDAALALAALGADFCFMGRQYRITVGGRHHFIDLLFFHRRLRCLVAVDLKLGTFGYEDAGQMNFYLNYLAAEVALPGESAPVGIVLCAEKDAAEVHYATGGLDRQIFVSRYLVALPTEEQLRAWLAEEREALVRAQIDGPVAAGGIRQTASAESDPEGGADR